MLFTLIQALNSLRTAESHTETEALKYEARFQSLFLRQRIPAVRIANDSRHVGGATLKTFGLNPFAGVTARSDVM